MYEPFSPPAFLPREKVFKWEFKFFKRSARVTLALPPPGAELGTVTGRYVVVFKLLIVIIIKGP